MKAQKAEGTLPSAYEEKEMRRIKELGLEPADSIEDKTEISCFQRGSSPHWSGINTFLKLPYLEDVRKVGEYDVAFVGVPFDIGCTFRSGTRFGPQGMRRISALYQKYSYEHGHRPERDARHVRRRRHLLPGQHHQGPRPDHQGRRAHPVAGHAADDHGRATTRSAIPSPARVAQCVEGKVGIIHLDRHVDTQEKDMDEIMHTCPWFHATNIPNCPPSNLVQLGIGGWQVPRAGVKVGRERGTTILTVNDIEKIGIDKTIEIALEVAWKGASAVYLSFDIDALDAGLRPRHGLARAGRAPPPRGARRSSTASRRRGSSPWRSVEVSPPYDISDITSLLGVRLMVDVLGDDGQERPHRRPPEGLSGRPWPDPRSSSRPTSGRTDAAWARTEAQAAGLQAFAARTLGVAPRVGLACLPSRSVGRRRRIPARPGHRTDSSATAPRSSSCCRPRSS